MADSVLVCLRLDAGYGRIPVVRGFELELAEGEIVAMVGPNGAGKTTLLMTLAGLLPPLAGSVEFAGEVVSTRRPDLNARRGLVLVPDSRQLVSALTTQENLTLARRRGGLTLTDMTDFFPALGPLLKRRAGALSGGEQQMLAVARALIQRPRAILVDEMSMGLAPLIRQELMARVQRSAKDLNMAALLVEQHVDLALRVADRAIVLAQGETRLVLPARELAADRRRLAQAYLGADATADD